MGLILLAEGGDLLVQADNLQSSYYKQHSIPNSTAVHTGGAGLHQYCFVF